MAAEQDFDKEFEQAADNARRREIVVEAFQAGALNGKAKDFFIEQFNKGEIYDGELNSETAVKLAGLLNLKPKQDNVEEQLLNMDIRAEDYSPVGREATAVRTARNLSRELKKNRARIIKAGQQRTQDLAMLDAQANGAYSGPEAKYADLANQARQQQKSLKWYNFGAKRRADKLLRAIDPEQYYQDKLQTTNAYNPAKLIYGWRAKHSQRQNIAEMDTALAKTMELNDTATENRFWSKNMFKVLKAKAQLWFRRSPQNKAQKMVKKMNLDQLNSFSAVWNQQLEEAKAGLANTPIKDKRKMYQARIDNLTAMLTMAQESAKNKRQAYDGQLQSILNNQPSLDSSVAQNAQAFASELESSRQDILARDPEYQMLQKLISSSSPEIRKLLEETAHFRQNQKITDDQVFRTLLQHENFSDQQIAQVLDSLNINDDTINQNVDGQETQTESESPQEETEKETTPQPPQEQQEEEVHAESQSAQESTPILGEGQTPDGARDNNHTPHDVAPLSALFQGNDNYVWTQPLPTEKDNSDSRTAQTASFQNKEDGHFVTVERGSDNDYYVSAQDQDGKDRTASVDDMKEIMTAMVKGGEKTIELGEVKSPEFLARAELAAEKAGITISNLEEKKKELMSRDAANENKFNNESERAAARDAAKELGIDLYSQEGQKQAASKLNDLAAVQNMSKEEYNQFQELDTYKNMSTAEKKLFDNVHKLTTDEEYKKSAKSVRDRNLSKLIANYQAANNEYNRASKKHPNKRNIVQRSETFVKAAVRNMGQNR